jgi:alpha-D-ribose 1-methylphosphonate 5-triphosphate synthase subunit PhnH
VSTAHVVDLAGIPAGLADAVHHAQASFRMVLDALSRPGRLQSLPASVQQGLGRPALLSPALAAVLLTLLDAETSLWLAPAFATAEVKAWLSFHTGTRFADTPDSADFAAARADAVDAALLASLPAGNDEAPHTSATLLIDVPSLANEALPPPSVALSLTGPGIEHEHCLCVGGVTLGFWHARVAQQQAFPCGVDLLLCGGDRVAGLPRSTHVLVGEG